MIGYFLLFVCLGLAFIWIPEEYLPVEPTLGVMVLAIWIEYKKYSFRKALSLELSRQEKIKYLLLVFYLTCVLIQDYLWWPCKQDLLKGHYYSGAVGQQILFFILMPGWLEWKFSRQASYLVSAFVYVLIHFPNWPLVGATIIGAVIFTCAYYRKGWRVIFLMAPLHCMCGSFLGKGWGLGWTLRVGISYVSKWGWHIF